VRKGKFSILWQHIILDHFLAMLPLDVLWLGQGLWLSAGWASHDKHQHISPSPCNCHLSLECPTGFEKFLKEKGIFFETILLLQKYLTFNLIVKSLYRFILDWPKRSLKTAFTTIHLSPKISSAVKQHFQTKFLASAQNTFLNF
jgi:hypothetical protein